MTNHVLAGTNRDWKLRRTVISYNTVIKIDSTNITTGMISKLLRSARTPAMLGKTPTPIPAAATRKPMAFAPCNGPSGCCTLVTINAQMGASVKP